MSKNLDADPDCLPARFQDAWRNHPDPSALPFSPYDAPFNLTSEDLQQLSLSDAEFTPHTWTELQNIIAAGRLDQLKRWPSQLKAYLAWTASVKQKYGSATRYLLQRRLLWDPIDGHDALRFSISNNVPFASPDDYNILRNDWPYALTDDIRHIVVWSKMPLPVDEAGVLTTAGHVLVESFVQKTFRAPAGEGAGSHAVGSKVMWFKNSTNLQSVRSLEHVHVLVRRVDDELLQNWMQ